MRIAAFRVPIVSPAEVIGEEERDRLETQWNSKFRRGGTGRVVVAESSLKVSLLKPSLGDLAALADMKATKEDIANAFHVPLSFLTSETNLANLQAAEDQHMSKAIIPRLQRRDEKLNEQLVPLFDPSGRLFLMSQDPTPGNLEKSIQQLEMDLKYGLRTINEVRANDRGDDAGSLGRRALAAAAMGPHRLCRPRRRGNAAHRPQPQGGVIARRRSMPGFAAICNRCSAPICPLPLRALPRPPVQAPVRLPVPAFQVPSPRPCRTPRRRPHRRSTCCPASSIPVKEMPASQAATLPPFR